MQNTVFVGKYVSLIETLILIIVKNL